MMPLEVKNSFWLSILQSAGSAIFVWMCWSALKTGTGGNIIFWAGLILFPSGVLIGTYHLLDRRAKILLDQHGIYFPGNHDKIISWKDVAHFKASELQHKALVELELKNGDFFEFSFFRLNTTSDELNKYVRRELRRIRREKQLKLESEDEEKSSAEESATMAEFSNVALEENDEDENDNEEEIDEEIQAILEDRWIMPAWFSSDAVTNELTWVGVIVSVSMAILMVVSWYDPAGYPKISIIAQIAFVIGAGPVAMLLWYLRNWRDFSDYRSRRRKK